jgi:hypothetical protein
MELVDVICNAHFSDTRVGSLSRKQVVKLPAHIAKELAALDLVTIRNPIPAVLQPRPLIAQAHDGGAEPRTFSQVDQALPTEMPKLFRRGRPRKDAS